MQRMTPARQGLHAANAPGLQVKLRLHVHLQRPHVDRGAQIARQNQPLAPFLVQIRMGEQHLGSAIAGLVSGQLCRLQQALGIARPAPADGNADGGLDVQTDRCQLRHWRQADQRPIGFAVRGRLVGIGQKQRKFRLRHARQQRRRQRLEPAGDVVQELIAAGLSQRGRYFPVVLDLHYQHGKGTGAAGGYPGRVLDKTGLVGQPGHSIKIGQVAQPDIRHPLTLAQVNGGNAKRQIVSHLGQQRHFARIERIGLGGIEGQGTDNAAVHAQRQHESGPQATAGGHPKQLVCRGRRRGVLHDHRLSAGDGLRGRCLMRQRGVPVRLQVSGKATVVAGPGHRLDTGFGDIDHPGATIAAHLDPDPTHRLQQRPLVLLSQQDAITGAQDRVRPHGAVDTVRHVVEGVAHGKQLGDPATGRQAHPLLASGQTRRGSGQLADRLHHLYIDHQPGQRRQQKKRA